MLVFFTIWKVIESYKRRYSDCYKSIPKKSAKVLPYHLFFLFLGPNISYACRSLCCNLQLLSIFSVSSLLNSLTPKGWRHGGGGKKANRTMSYYVFDWFSLSRHVNFFIALLGNKRLHLSSARKNWKIVSWCWLQYILRTTSYSSKRILDFWVSAPILIFQDMAKYLHSRDWCSF